MFVHPIAYTEHEMQRVQERVQAYTQARDQGDPTLYADYVRAARAERISISTARKLHNDQGGNNSAEWVLRRYPLTPLEEDALWILSAFHLCSATARLLLHAQGHTTHRSITLAFLTELLALSFEERTALTHTQNTLFRNTLAVVLRPPAYPNAPRFEHLVQAPSYVAHALQGSLRLDDRLHHAATLIEPTAELFDLVLPATTQTTLDAFLPAFCSPSGKPVAGPLKLLVTGPAGNGKTTLIHALTRLRREPLLSVDLSKLPADRSEDLRVAYNNAAFLHSVLHIHRPQSFVQQGYTFGSLVETCVAQFPGMVVVETRDDHGLEDALGVFFDSKLHLERPGVAQRTSIWESALPIQPQVSPDIDVQELGRRYELSGAQIHAATRWGTRICGAAGRDTLEHSDLAAGAKAQLRSQLGDLTSTASQVHLSMDKLVLPPDVLKQVQQLLAACRNQSKLLNTWGFGEHLATGKGLVALFLGEAGTGKTLTAEILAAELGIRLRIVSIPKVTSKWVGETEKNIQKIFAQARADNSMLLFDEADSLFARRVKVERSSDHFQNMEVNNLLQEIERFEGLVVLTTNLETNMDPAFARRILYRIEFPVPGFAERRLIWRKLIPDRVPLGHRIHFDGLARDYELTGGQIKNAVIRAAYESLQSEGVLLNHHLHNAAQHEAASAGRLIRVEGR